MGRVRDDTSDAFRAGSATVHFAKFLVARGRVRSGWRGVWSAVFALGVATATDEGRSPCIDAVRQFAGYANRALPEPRAVYALEPYVIAGEIA